MFLCIHENISAIEQPNLVSDCECVWAKLSLKCAQDLYVGSFYMPHRNIEGINELNHSLSKLNSNSPKNILLGGDFNCQDIDWDTNVQHDQCTDRNVQESLIDLANDNSLSQIHRETTRENKLLDLIFTSNPSLAKSSSIPGISDHDITISYFDIRP